MSFFAVLFALLIEQLRPMPRDNPVLDALKAWVAWVGRNFDAGKPHHGWVVWAVSVLGPTLLVAAVYLLVHHYSVLAALAIDVLVLYLTLGFRQFSHHFTGIRDALDRGDETEAKRLLADWRHLDASELPRTELLRHVIEHSLLAAHRHVFGVFFWFVVLSALGLGPAGAVFYRMADFVRRYWAYRQFKLDVPLNEGLRERVLQAFTMLDHIPARMTAFGFAVVGNFEEAIASWRRDAGLWRHPNEGILLAAAAGAVGVQLGGRAPPGVTPDRSKSFHAGEVADTSAAEGSTAGIPPQMGHLQSMVGLVWRSVILWMLLLALLTLASIVG
jgi:adenosylcobinamide-phosphate synthase